MRAYLIGYHHGINDGYMSTLIERGGCEAMQDESLDVEYVTIEQVLEIIDEEYEYWKEWDSHPEAIFENIKKAVVALNGGEQE